MPATKAKAAKVPRAKKPAPAAEPKTALVLRTCGADMTSYGGFLWPESGPVECPDWKPTKQCGNGLHGFLWGEGKGGLASWGEGARWLVVEVIESDVIDLDGKVKFPRGVVVHCGDRFSAGGTATAGDRGTATAGYRGTATAGYGGTATAGDGGTATAGYGGTATAGYRGTATAGDGGTATAGDGGTATAGYGGTATAGDGGNERPNLADPGLARNVAKSDPSFRAGCEAAGVKPTVRQARAWLAQRGRWSPSRRSAAA
jgi:hypothetical protein